VDAFFDVLQMIIDPETGEIGEAQSCCMRLGDFDGSDRYGYSSRSALCRSRDYLANLLSGRSEPQQ
jgi:hypothetical protein